MTLRRGLSRLGAGAVVLWFVFWTFAYVFKARMSETDAPLPPAFSPTTDIALVVTAILAGSWIVSGFRSD